MRKALTLSSRIRACDTYDSRYVIRNSKNHWCRPSSWPLIKCTPDSCSHDEVRHIMIVRIVGLNNRSIIINTSNFMLRISAGLVWYYTGGGLSGSSSGKCWISESMDTEGVAIGGETIGFWHGITVDVIQWVHPYLPENKPRYTMGVGMSPRIWWMLLGKVSICLIVSQPLEMHAMGLVLWRNRWGKSLVTI